MKSQNESDVTQWVHNYSDALFKYAASRIKDAHTAKDLVQETFLAAWRNIENYNGDASVKTWLYTILKNKIIDYYRYQTKRKTDELTTNNQDEYFDAADHWTGEASPQNWETSADHSIVSKEFNTVLDKCKMKLKEIQGAVFSMKYLDGLSSEEICKVLDISSSNYWVVVHRAKLQLRSCLEKNWFLK